MARRKIKKVKLVKNWKKFFKPGVTKAEALKIIKNLSNQ
jgi:uncharacterized protein YeeX (DUF496 family)